MSSALLNLQSDLYCFERPQPVIERMENGHTVRACVHLFKFSFMLLTIQVLSVNLCGQHLAQDISIPSWFGYKKSEICLGNIGP